MSKHTPAPRQSRVHRRVVGIPDAGMYDTFRNAMFTSITMTPSTSSNPHDYGYWTYADPNANFAGVTAYGTAPRPLTRSLRPDTILLLLPGLTVDHQQDVRG